MAFAPCKSLSPLALGAALLLAGCDRPPETPREPPGTPMPPKTAPETSPANTPATSVEGIGEVKALDVEQNRVTLAHEPIPALNWPAMTMPFALSSPALLQGLQEGQRVRFTLEGESTITSIEPLP